MKKDELVVSHDRLKRITRRANGTVRVQHVSDLPDLTEQTHIAECDVNNIIKKFRKTGQLSHVRSAAAGQYSDLADLDFETMQNGILHAKHLFEQIPSEIRNRFGHDPQALIEFIRDPENHEEAVKLGLMAKREPAKPTVEQTLEQIAQNTKPQNVTKAKKTSEKTTES